MLNTNVMIQEDQEEKLRAISLETGVDHDELIRCGVDLAIPLWRRSGYCRK